MSLTRTYQVDPIGICHKNMSTSMMVQHIDKFSYVYGWIPDFWSTT